MATSKILASKKGSNLSIECIVNDDSHQSEPFEAPGNVVIAHDHIEDSFSIESSRSLCF